MSKLFVVAKMMPDQAVGGEELIQIRSEWAIFAETPEQAVAAYANPLAFDLPEGDVPDAWYDTDVAVEVKRFGGLKVFGPYENA